MLPQYLEILIATSSVFFIVLCLLSIILIFAVLSLVGTIKSKAVETLETIQMSAYNLSETGLGLNDLVHSLASFFSPRKRSIIELITDILRKK